MHRKPTLRHMDRLNDLVSMAHPREWPGFKLVFKMISRITRNVRLLETDNPTSFLHFRHFKSFLLFIFLNVLTKCKLNISFAVDIFFVFSEFAPSKLSASAISELHLQAVLNDAPSG